MVFPDNNGFQRYKGNMMQDKMVVFKHCLRLVRCMIDCHQEFQDAVTVLNALQLARSIQAKAWDDSPHVLRQLDNIGPVSLRKLVNAGVRNLKQMEVLQPHQIETIISRNPPFGTNVLKNVKLMPRFKISMSQVGNPKVSGPLSGPGFS